MEAQDFRALVDQLGDLTEVQRAALAAALAGQNSANEAIAMIQTRFALSPICGHCKSQQFWSWGMASGLKRYTCRDCNRTFNALTGTPLAQLHRRDAWLDYARAMVDRTSLRKAAERADICLETSFRWRHRFLQAARDKRPSVVTGIVEADETFILKSAKGSKRIVGRPQESAAARQRSSASRPTSMTVFSSFATATRRPPTTFCLISKAVHSKRISSPLLPRTPCWSVMAAPPTVSSRTPPALRTSPAL